jgi:hypothetical protein
MQFTITLLSGATVGLTKSQEKAIADILFGEQKTPEVKVPTVTATPKKKKRRRAFGAQKWSAAEDEAIKDRISKNLGQFHFQDAKVVSGQLRRTPVAVYQRYQTAHKTT